MFDINEFITQLVLKRRNDTNAIDKATEVTQPQVDNKQNRYDNYVNRALNTVPSERREMARENIYHIVKALDEEGILTDRTLAYALATVEHETGSRFQPVREGFSDAVGRNEAIKRGYGGGANYYGRGYIQLTHNYNYRDMGQKLGLGNQLAENPDMALDPEISAKILAKFFKERGVVNYAEKGDFYGARRPVNGVDRADKIAARANAYLGAVKTEGQPYVEMKQAEDAMPKPTPTAFIHPMVKPVKAAEESMIYPTPVATPQQDKTIDRAMGQFTGNRNQSVRQVGPAQSSLANRYFNPVVNNSFGSTGGSYNVNRGDNLTKIARQLGTSVAELIHKNPQIKNPNLIYPNQKINY
jgi:predicted chitinase